MLAHSVGCKHTHAMAEVVYFNTERHEREEPVEIPYHELSADALLGVVKSFVLREGTDYGMTEFTLEQKIVHVMKRIERGEAKIFFDPSTQTVDIVKAPTR
jgi:uncharacterized protein